MCQKVTCQKCGKPSFVGCGMHVESVLRDVPKEQRCKCREQASWKTSSPAQRLPSTPAPAPVSLSRRESDDPIATRYTDPSAVIIDVRGPDEVASGTLKRAINIVHVDIAHAGRKLPSSKSTPIMVFCRSGGRAATAMQSLKQMGYTNVLNAGGYAQLKYLDNLPRPQGLAKSPTKASQDPLVALYASPASFIIDVRSAEEVADGTLKRAVNIPHVDIMDSKKLLPASKSTPIMVFCRSGARANMALSMLHQMGYVNVVNGGGYSDVTYLDIVVPDASLRPTSPRASTAGRSNVTDPAAKMYSDPTALILDVRSPEEVKEGTLKRALNIPHSDISSSLKKLPVSKVAPIMVFCRSGGRAGMAMDTLKQMGYANVLNAGGYSELKHLDSLIQEKHDISPLELEAMREVQHVDASKEMLKQLCPRTKFPVQTWTDGIAPEAQAYMEDLPGILDRTLTTLSIQMPANPRVRLAEALFGPNCSALSSKEVAELQRLLDSHTTH